ncbi:hypothetical protein Y032_0036g3218 [Ancylostoma ceylanicum]|uniref:Uncharacterized protein n=1 Tax=Ancylostoma ceylanicum TaxID=53326 RepID=A0A016UL13_9BILA|nr:hypothetical protein Y032_0036g3218 [Ancylostoma ceylanicum]
MQKGVRKQTEQSKQKDDLIWTKTADSDRLGAVEKVVSALACLFRLGFFTFREEKHYAWSPVGVLTNVGDCIAVSPIVRLLNSVLIKSSPNSYDSLYATRRYKCQKTKAKEMLQCRQQV